MITNRRLRPLAAAALCFGCFACHSTSTVTTPRDDGRALDARRSPCPSGMVAVPAGSFAMGSTDGDDDEKPVHPVDVRAFCMDRTEVTVEAYAGCVARAACKPARVTVEWPKIEDGDRQLLSKFCNAAAPDRAKHPINCVDWNDADTYCRAVGKRLPTEEEWEYAARGAGSRRFPWGEADPGPALLDACGAECTELGRELHQEWDGMYAGSDGAASTAPVGSYPAGRSSFGLDDMAGNVWEWTASMHCDYAKPTNCNDERVNRGGGWYNGFPPDVRAANRNDDPPTTRNRDLGFRCAR
jgi:formylglycine-generating enzyme required for sulfatase activity